jgi:alanine dehydrogenase
MARPRFPSSGQIFSLRPYISAAAQELVMKIGVPKEIKIQEYRVGLTPAGVRELTQHGHQVLVEHAAGLGIGYDDEAYRLAGASIAASAGPIFETAQLIVKVKEPQPVEVARLRPGQVLFTYLHLAADKIQTDGLIRSGATCIAYETVTDRFGTLPLLAPMSEVAGRMAIQVGAHCLEREQGGVGILLGGVPGVPPAKVVVLGGGVSGTNAARMAVGLEASVTIIDRSIPRLKELDLQFGARATTLFATTEAIERSVLTADLVIGAVLVPGAAAPKLVTRELVRENAAWLGVGRYRHRSGRVFRDEPPNLSFGPDLCGGGRGALLRDQHAGRGASHIDLCADQRDAALRDGAGGEGLAAGDAGRSVFA